jgi:hypothetical protein
MPLKIDEFRGYLPIDKLRLDDEVVQQPALFYEASEACAEAITERDARREELSSVDADLDAEARTALSEPKEAEVKAYIQSHARHKKATAEWLDAKELADKLTALKEAFKQRSYSMRILADLHVSNYFESASLKTTAATDKLVYDRQRARLAEGRKK